MRLIILFINILALYRCAFSFPIDKKHQNKIDNNDNDIDNEVEEMRNKLEAWSLSKQRKKAENTRNYDDHDSDQRTISAVKHRQHTRKKINEKDDKQLAELHLIKDKHGEASGSNKSGNNRRHNYHHHKSKSSDLHRRSTELHSISRRHSADSINESRGQRRRSKELSESPVNRKNKQIVPMDWKKPPPSPDRNQNKHIVPYKQKSIVLRRKEESVEDLQKIQNEMSAIIAQTMNNQKGMRDEAYALQIASNVQPTNIEVLRPKQPQMLARLSRKIKPEPENWTRNLAKTFEGGGSDKRMFNRIQSDKNQTAFINSYYGYWGDNFSPPKSKKWPFADQSDQNRQQILEAPSAGQLEQACSSHGDQTPLYLMDGTSTHVDHNDNDDNEEIIHHRSSSSSDDGVFMHRPESNTELDSERSLSPIQRHYSVDQRQSSLQRKSVKEIGSKSGRIIAGSDEDLSKSKIKAYDENSSRTDDQRRIYSRRTTFHGSSSTSSDKFPMQRKYFEGSKRADHLKLKENADQDHFSQGLYYQDNTTIADQENIEDDEIFDLDELEEEAAVRVAIKHSVEEAEKIKREDEEQLRIAMEHSVMDEIQKRKSKKKGTLEKLKSLIPRPPQIISNNFIRASSSENLSYDNDDDAAFQKALRDSIHDQK